MSRSRFEELAERWVPGEGPVVVEPLSTGLVNDSCRVTRGGRLFSLRSSAAHADGLVPDRHGECALLALAAAAGVAPGIRCCEPLHGILVADWVAGRPWSAEELRAPANIDAMARLLRRVHALEIPASARRMDPCAWISHYSTLLARSGLLPSRRSAGLRGAAEAHLAKLAKDQAPAAVLCHSDLHRLNVVVGDHIVLLDWEYAHAANAFWDLAGWAANNDWTEFESRHLLTSYLQRPVRTEDLARLRHWAWLYDYVCLLWSDAFVGRGPRAANLEVLARAEIVANRLQC